MGKPLTWKRNAGEQVIGEKNLPSFSPSFAGLSQPVRDLRGEGLWFVLVQRRHMSNSGMDRQRNIFRASLSGISVCRGTASQWPVRGLHHREYSTALSFQIAPMFAKAPQESASFHWTITTSRIASRGIPRRASSRRSSRMSDMASARL